MNKPASVSDSLKVMQRLSRGEMTPDAVRQLRQAIRSRTSLLVSAAVDIATDRGLTELLPEIEAAFDRFLVDGEHTDKGCRAKTSIAVALNHFEFTGTAVFLGGVRYVQLEASFGPKEDTAIDVRCECIRGLARINHPNCHLIFVYSLVDLQTKVRVAAVKALAFLGEPEGQVMLRLTVLKANLAVDKEAEVVAECFAGLMSMAPQTSLEFVSRYLSNGSSELFEFAALAIGGSHVPESFGILHAAWDDNLSPTVRQRLLLPIALVRSDEAFDFLLEVLRSSDRKVSLETLLALRLYQSDSDKKRVGEVVRKKGDKEMTRRYEEEFGS